MLCARARVVRQEVEPSWSPPPLSKPLYKYIAAPRTSPSFYSIYTGGGDGGREKRATARCARDEKRLHLLLESRARDEHEVYDREDQRDEEQVAHRFPERVPVADALAHALNTLVRRS